MLVLKCLVGVAFQIALLAVCLFLPAGTWDWPRAVQYLVLYGIVVTVAVCVLARVAPRGLEARLMVPAAKSQPMADRIATTLIIAAIIVWFVFIPIDVFRLRFLSSPSLLVSVLGAAISFIGLGIMLITVYQNEFVAPIVKDQSERGQILVDTGLYGCIRHPMYLGILGWLFGLALWLESTAGALAVLAFLPIFFARIRVEERTLRETLEGYADYMARVPYRLVPFVW